MQDRYRRFCYVNAYFLLALTDIVFLGLTPFLYHFCSLPNLHVPVITLVQYSFSLLACSYFFYNLLCCLVIHYLFSVLRELVANPVYFMSLVQDSSLALQVLTNIETYLVEEEIRMVKLDKNCEYTRKNYI